MAEINSQPVDLKPERLDTYKVWQAEQKIPCIRGFFVKDVNQVPVEYWDLKGVPCYFVVLDGTGGTNERRGGGYAVGAICWGWAQADACVIKV